MTNNTSPTSRLSISGGPSREDLFDALRLRHERRPIWVKVHLVDRRPEEHKFVVNGVAVEDGSGQNWLLSLLHEKSSTVVHGYYNSRTRAGYLDFPA